VGYVQRLVFGSEDSFLEEVIHLRVSLGDQYSIGDEEDNDCCKENAGEVEE
jgi:hypothetical protein